MRYKIIAYFDEAGDNPALSCTSLNKQGIKKVCLRNIYKDHIEEASDVVLVKTKNLLTEAGIMPVMLHSDLNYLSADDKIKHIFNLSSYFGVSKIRFSINSSCQATAEFMHKLSMLAKSYAVELLAEPSCRPDSSSVQFLHDFIKSDGLGSKWSVLYDAAGLSMNGADHYKRYWPVLQPYTSAVTITDLVVFNRYVPAGLGDIDLDNIIKDSVGLWHVIRPSLGSKFGNEFTSDGTFDLAFKSYLGVSDGN